MTSKHRREGQRGVKRAGVIIRRSGKLALVFALVAVSSACTRFENAMASIPVFSFLRDGVELVRDRATKEPAKKRVACSSSRS